MRETKWSKDGLAYHPLTDTVWSNKDGVLCCVGDPWDITLDEWKEIEQGQCEYVMG